MLGLAGQGVCPLPGTLCYLRGGRRHVQPAHCGGQADLDPAADGGSLGAAGPGGTRAQADRNLVDGMILGRAPPKTDTAEEITMADVVPA